MNTVFLSSCIALTNIGLQEIGYICLMLQHFSFYFFIFCSRLGNCMCEDCKVEFKSCFCECGILQLIETIQYMGMTIKSICYCRLCSHYLEIKHKYQENEY